MNTKLVASVILSAGILSGCASIVSDSSYPVSITSSPSEASFTVENHTGAVIHSGRTPATVTLKSGDGYFGSSAYTITFNKDGYEEKTYLLESTMDGWYWGNILIGGLIGFLVVDPLTGAMWKLPEVNSVSLDEKVDATASTGAELKVVDINELSEDEKSKLERVN